jgi:hypothetical protein
MLLSPFLLMAQQNSGAWTNIGPSPAAVQAIAVDPRGTGTIFMGTIRGGVRKSVDRGITWSAANTGLTDLEVLTLAIDASGPQTVYAGGGGLFKTSDGGATWKIMPAISGVRLPGAPTRTGPRVYAAVFNNRANGSDPEEHRRRSYLGDYLSHDSFNFNITIDPGTRTSPCSDRWTRRFKSTDGGQSWSLVSALTPAAI